jgi:transposase
MKAIHGGKAKNDKLDAHKIAVLLRGGMLPQAYVYPAEMRATRELLRRRMHLMRKRAERLAHIQNTNNQDNLPEIGKKIGNAYLKWAFSEAAVLFRRNNPAGQKYLARLEKQHGKGKALTVLAQQFARAVYYMVTRDTAFDLDKCFKE